MLRRWGFSFTNKIQMLLLVFVLLPFAVVSGLSYYVIKDVVTNKFISNTERMLEVISIQMEKAIDEMAYASSLSLQNSSFFDSLSVISGKTRFETYQDFLALETIKNFLVGAEGRVYQADAKMFLVTRMMHVIAGDRSAFDMQRIETWIRSDFESFERSPNSAVHWDRVALNEAADPSQSAVHYVARPFLHPVTGRVEAVLYIGIPYAYWQEMLGQTSTGTITLTDQTGQVIYRGGVPVPDGSRSVIEAEVRLEKAHWRLHYVALQKEITGELTGIFTFFTSVIILFSVAFLLASLYSASRLNKPLQQLKKVLEKFGQGERKVRYTPSGKDEIALMGKAFNQMLNEIEALLVRIEEEQEAKRMMELKALYAQIRPHFLLNTLTSIKLGLTMEGEQKHSDKIGSLIRLLKAYTSVHGTCSLQSEINLLVDYINIMNMRSGLEIQLEVQLDEDLSQIMIPRLLLQPIIENSIIHGFADPPPKPVIRVQARGTGGNYIIVVEDNGSGMSIEVLEVLNQRMNGSLENPLLAESHVGLINTRNRICLHYGSASAIGFSLSQGRQGLRVELRLPCLAWEEETYV